MLGLYFFFNRLVFWYFKKFLNIPFFFPKPSVLILNHTTKPNKFLGYRYGRDPKKFIFFSFLKNFFYKNNQFKRPNSRFISSHLLTKKIYFIYFLRDYFSICFRVGNRDHKINKFFQVFTTWKAVHIAYAYHYSVVYILLRIGFSLNTQTSLMLLRRNYIFTKTNPIASRWELITGTKYLQVVYNRYIYVYLLRLRKLYRIFSSVVMRLYWLVGIQRISFSKIKVFKKLNYSNMFFTLYYLPNYNPCFLTLTFVFWPICWDFYDWYWYKWVNWLNFLSHNWKYLS